MEKDPEHRTGLVLLGNRKGDNPGIHYNAWGEERALIAEIGWLVVNNEEIGETIIRACALAIKEIEKRHGKEGESHEQEETH